MTMQETFNNLLILLEKTGTKYNVFWQDRNSVIRTACDDGVLAIRFDVEETKT